MTSNNRDSFWDYAFAPFLALIPLAIVLIFVIFYTPNSRKPGAVRLETKNAKCVYIGNIDGTSMDVYKLTEDSVDYILIKSYQGVTITKAH